MGVGVGGTSDRHTHHGAGGSRGAGGPRFEILVFPGNRANLALDMELSLRLASLRAGIEKWPNTGVFRRMKVWDYRVADVGPGVVARAIGRTREFGWRREVGLLEGLREAKRVLEMEPEPVEGLWRRIVNGVNNLALKNGV